MTLFSNDVKLNANDWTFLKLSAVEREIDNIFCEISSLKASPFRAIGVFKGTTIGKWRWLTATEKNE